MRIPDRQQRQGKRKRHASQTHAPAHRRQLQGLDEASSTQAKPICWPPHWHEQNSAWYRKIAWFYSFNSAWLGFQFVLFRKVIVYTDVSQQLGNQFLYRLGIEYFICGVVEPWFENLGSKYSEWSSETNHDT
ncbi:hypothetical protein TWF970_006375 [Orbilia oligospora]|uniref:Uncharacterized protein n=1 Tax=Orbilia oligospora TaxID=2813651 RepID=A0A7C8RB88_ORBOL|nr:hypothetical protein TWF970_006375 [Orbilia oligospora]